MTEQGIFENLSGKKALLPGFGNEARMIRENLSEFDESFLVLGSAIVPRLEPTETASENRLTEAYEELESISEDCSSPEWDGYSAEPISNIAIERTKKFLDLIPDNIPVPEIVPQANGGLSLEWYRSPDSLFDISVEKEGPLIFAGKLSPSSRLHGETSLESNFPAELEYFLNLLYR